MTMARLFVASLLLVILALMLFWNGNLLLWSDPFQVCIGWPDDTVYSWWCTADLTVVESIG